LDFFTILYGFYKSLDQEVKKLRIYFFSGPRKSLNLHTYTLDSSRKVPGGFRLHSHALQRRGKLAGGEAGPGVVNKRGGRSIELTCDRSAAVAWPEKSLAMAGGETVAVRPPRLQFQ
jgi:hypothetical protein